MRGSLLLFLFLAGNLGAASFDCQRAKGEVENLVCSDPNLSRLDDVLARLYRSALKASWQAKAELVSSQRKWIAQRDLCANRKENSRRECVEIAYRNRIKNLYPVLFHGDTGHYRCNWRGKTADNLETNAIAFEIKRGVVETFEVSTTHTSSDLALGYAVTCYRGPERLVQVQGGKTLVLTSIGRSVGRAREEEPENCAIRITDLGSHFHVRSTDCAACLDGIDIRVRKDGTQCRQVSPNHTVDSDARKSGARGSP